MIVFLGIYPDFWIILRIHKSYKNMKPIKIINYLNIDYAYLLLI